MAESLFDTQSPLNCPICLNLLKNPVTTTCGHSFCMDCIKRCWDLGAIRGVYSCPTCRKRFNKRPALGKSKVLADILEGMKQEAPAGPGDVKCDVCKGRKVKAIRSCLVCMASYCQTHIRPHLESKAFKIHKLVKASPNLQQQICPQHHKALEVYCYNDRKCICVVCMGNQHSGHKMVSAAAAMAKKQEELKIKKRDFIQKTNNLKKEVYQCKKAVISYKRSAQAAVEHSDKIFTEIICSIQKRQAEVRENIRAQENKEVQDAENHIETLEKEICILQEESRKLEPLLHTEDHVHFFQNYSFSFGILPYNFIVINKKVNNLTFERLERSLSELKSQLDDVFEEHMGETFDEVDDVQIFKKRILNKRKRGPEWDPDAGAMESVLTDDDDDDDDDNDNEDDDDSEGSTDTIPNPNPDRCHHSFS
ncbi:E3 ubiquitin/ISG15 ligase TRIM25-like isoform X1 [Ctenopharyngodon idella]|uniref:E3 ubiquitin/ISG15 ligase TRIM25-like isoform X1 n=1 Tax=Ctenopharyngodon idella TaxID=7959 RepID=UPI0022314085|nr:E3 ubiquitin/ISG15 ligase TRIM25-like isoform X1 [Ctenopharyngodon idella]XP_051772708.1 E3 ubiquitin/ISG15 ligase TRIM25-like isoform X1 [Ctenopharyngodon idella]XP_051772709.1 E3 ubiquitin/ISG15 ligase TRIM25-like isoform X1 [Ctenopharyngodon idella]XP_051772710.1 E3 ubiquitin/ISG15 ligase TRIM25-like isoform X1 [Ctenopharyngodon idella]XP_051772711.1 E3 ubiquitin/ISG15 ligase TRIM25-like isoform X1 [Ctenopharyngodon idella]